MKDGLVLVRAVFLVTIVACLVHVVAGISQVLRNGPTDVDASRWCLVFVALGLLLTRSVP